MACLRDDSNFNHLELCTGNSLVIFLAHTYTFPGNVGSDGIVGLGPNILDDRSFIGQIFRSNKDLYKAVSFDLRSGQTSKMIIGKPDANYSEISYVPRSAASRDWRIRVRSI